MKQILTAFFTLLISLHCFSQPTSEVTILIIACKTGVLIVDGNEIGPVEADDAKKQTLSYGEHYLQLKTATGKHNLTIDVDKDTKGIIKLGCDIENKTEPIRVIDKEVALSGALGTDVEKNVIGFDKDDEVIISVSLLNKKGLFTVSLFEYSTGREIYKKERAISIENDKITIPTKGIYYFLVYQEGLFSKSAKLTVDRKPSKSGKPNFNTAVKIVYDTTFTEVLNTVTRVYSTTNLDHSSRTSIKINLPQNTTYWAYWIGVGQESQTKFKSFAGSLSGVGTLLSTNPLVHFGLKLIPALPMLNTTSTISYKFTDSKNAQLFKTGMNYNYYTFKHADNISTDYSLIKQNFQDLVLNMKNSSALDGQDVEIKVVAFTVKPKWVLQE